MNFGWERQSYRKATVDSISTAADTAIALSQASSVSLVPSLVASESDRRPAAAAAKGSGYWQARLRLAIIVIVISVTSAVVLSPFAISWVIHVSQNSTRVEEMNDRLEEIMTNNVSYCPYPLAHTSKGGCFLPCSALDWLQHPTIRTIKPKLSYVLIVINLIAGIAFTFVWIALRKSHFKFPQVFVWYLFLCSIAMGAVELAAVIAGDENTICSSNDLIDSGQNPAAGCRVLGTLNHYLQICGVLLLTCSSANIWWVICFPTRARYFFEKTARIHAIQFSFCWILPGILIAITYAAGATYRPVPTSRFCLPMPEPIMLGTFVLPLSLSSITIIIMLAHVTNTLYNHRQFQKNHVVSTLSNASAHTPTKKIAAIQNLRVQFFAISVLIILMAILYETSYTLNSLGDTKVVNLLVENLICLVEKGNASSNASMLEACPETFRSYQYPALVILTDCQTILMILILIHYAVALKAVRKLILKWITFPFIRCRKSK
ncbi:uncharacterized protein [Oscarella lobularis]|uniref:uncharacterized protein isoform X2 n=1 Tax=Oscarella lobularis TaxID=121494 RepID=UPI003314450C